MAAGEYVSVSSQSYVERADRVTEMGEQIADPVGELEELVQIYQTRGLTRELAVQVAQALHAKDPLEAHLRDELGHHDSTKARPLQAAGASAISFTAGGMVPFLGMVLGAGEVRLISPFSGTGSPDSRMRVSRPVGAGAPVRLSWLERPSHDPGPARFPYRKWVPGRNGGRAQG